MNYFFEPGIDFDMLLTVGEGYTDISGYREITQVGENEVTRDKFFVVRKMEESEDRGTYYTRYEIKRHSREIDRTPMIQREVAEKTDKLEANQSYMSMMTGVDLPMEEPMEVKPDEV